MENITIEELISVLKQDAGKYKKCLLVGAVPSGRYLYKQLQICGLQERITYWTDKSYCFFQMYKLPVISLDEILDKDIDLIVIADRRNYCQWESIAAERGFSEVPFYMLECEKNNYPDFEYPALKYTNEEYNETELVCVNPVTLLTLDRLDIIIRYLACQEFMCGTPGLGVHMYKKFVNDTNHNQKRNRPLTVGTYFSDYDEKTDYKDFEKCFVALISSMQTYGFSKKHFIPVSESGKALNGRHRLAVALALGQKVYIKKYEGFGEPFFKYAQEDLKNLGFSKDEITLIIKTYNKLKKENV